MIPLGMLGSSYSRPASTSWSPSSIPGLFAWYDADDAASFTFSSGSLVSQWADKSSSGLHLVQATTGSQPSRSGTVNGRTAVLFDGSNDGLVTASAFTMPAKPATMLLIARNTATSGQRDAFMTTNFATADGRIFRTSGGTIDAYHGSFLSTGVQWGTTAPHSIAVIFNGSTSKIGIDSATAWTTGNAGDLNLGTKFAMGSYWGNGTEPWQGEICEAAFVTGAISDADRDKWFAYAKTKWGTA